MRNISAISESYELKDLELPPDRLLLDPGNPRIVLETQDAVLDYSPEELASEQVQEYVFSIIDKKEYHVAELIAGLRASGFLPGLHEIIVKQVGRTGKYLVIEGNRRVTAIKHLLQEEDKLEPGVLRTLRRLPVKEFIFTGNGRFSEEETIDVLMGAIHIKGPLEWGPIEKAHYIYRSYMRFLEKVCGGSDFLYDVSCSREVAILFNCSVKKVRKELIVYRVYEQLKRKGYQVRPKHYTLIDLAVGNRLLSSDYFGLDAGDFHFSPEGLERFNKLCIGDGTPISNPKDFRAFVDIYGTGTDHDRNLAESGTESVQEVLRRLNERRGDSGFQHQLEAIKEKLGSLVVAEFRGVSAEVEAIRRIKNLVDTRLWPLAQRRR